MTTIQDSQAAAGRAPAPAAAIGAPSGGRVWTPARRRLLLIILATKAATFLVALAVLRFVPCFNSGEYQKDIHWPREGPPTLATSFATWDAAHYLFLSEAGYTPGTPSCAFYPLWPWLIRAFARSTHLTHFAAGLILANLFSVAGLVGFHYLVASFHGLPTANTSTALLLAYPGAFYFSFIYTESLFFLLIVLFFLFLIQGRYVCLAFTGLLLPLTKAIGILCLVPILFHALGNGRRSRALLLAYYATFLGYGCYFLCMWRATGNAFEGFEAQRFFPNQPSLAHLVDPAGFLARFFMPVRLHGMVDSAIDRAAFVALLASLYWTYKLDRRYFAYSCLAGVVPAVSSCLLSYTRNLMMCFPLFIVGGSWFARPGRGFSLWFTILILATLQVWFLLRHINFVWVA